MIVLNDAVIQITWYCNILLILTSWWYFFSCMCLLMWRWHGFDKTVVSLWSGC